MSLEAFIDIRFGDPVLALALDFDGLVYGSMTGRLLYHHFSSAEEKTLREVSEECIRGVWLGGNRSLYAAIGDLSMLLYPDLGASAPQAQNYRYEREHSAPVCAATQVITFEDVSCLLQLEQQGPAAAENSRYVTGLMLKNFLTNVSTELIPLPLPTQCVPMDFDGERLLLLEYSPTGIRSLSLFDFRTRSKLPVFPRLTKSQGHLSFALLAGERFFYVMERRKLLVRSLTNTEERPRLLGQTKHDVVACTLVGVPVSRARRGSFSRPEGENLNEAQLDVRRHSEEGEEVTEKPQYSKLFILTADAQGLLQIWEESGPVESIHISECRELTREYQRMDYFSMGYPYVIAAFGPRLAVSTDHGVLVFKSKILEAQQVLRLDI